MTTPKDMTNAELLNRLQNSGGIALSAYQPIVKEARAELLRRLGAAGSASPLVDLQRDAARYWRLRVLGCAPCESKQLENGTVLRFSNLDVFIDHDIKIRPSRGEAELYESKISSGSVSTHGPSPKCPSPQMVEGLAGEHAERIVSNIETATQFEFREEDDYRGTIVLNVKKGLQYFLSRIAAAPAEDREGESMKTANDVIGDLEQLVAKLRGELREAGERTGRLRDERDTARLALREAKSKPEDVQLDVEAEKRIAEIRERESKATKGPWLADIFGLKIYPNPPKEMLSGNGTLFLATMNGSGSDREHCENNVLFAAHARADIPFLLEALLRRVSGKGAQGVWTSIATPPKGEDEDYGCLAAAPGWTIWAEYEPETGKWLNATTRTEIHPQVWTEIPLYRPSPAPVPATPLQRCNIVEDIGKALPFLTHEHLNTIEQIVARHSTYEASK